METMLILAAAAWVIAGVDFLFAYNREVRAKLQKVHS